ncbi:AMP-binding protein [Variovorax sp. LjRoot130]|uniref:AMP-binding protein n=1 Tax=Variovorax sp. LjRoot130 TaxID=3342261 RepID=UPI003ED0DCFB
MGPTDLRRCATRAPDHPAVVCGDARLSYAELEAMANRYARVLADKGLRRGDHVASLIGNRLEALALAWGAYRCGLYLTPMPTTLAVGEAAYMVRNAEARLVVLDASLGEPAARLADTVAGDVEWLSIGGAIANCQSLESLAEAQPPTARDHEPPGALMVYTSGTTGAPKGVWRPLPPEDFQGTPAFAADLLKLFGLGEPGVRYLSTAPLYHAAPLRFALAVTAAGGTVHVMERFDAALALDMLEREAITHSQWVPAMFQRMLALPDSRRRAFSSPSHRVAVHGAAPCSAALKRRMIAWWGPILLEYYSGSEGVGLTLIDSQESLRKPGSVGRCHKGEIHVLGTDGRELPAGETGVIHFSGTTPFAYFNEAAKTAARTSPQGWQTFGDVGHVDADGYLYLTDRQDDMIISGGVNIYPQEIEQAILEVPGVWECAVVGMSDERFGERPIAFVVPDRSRLADPKGLVAEVEAHNRECLGKFKQPSEIRIVEQLPRSPTGKLLRRVLRDGLSTPPAR